LRLQRGAGRARCVGEREPRAACLTARRAVPPRQAVSSTAELDAYLSSQHGGGGSDAENQGQGRRAARTVQRKTGPRGKEPAPPAASTKAALSHAVRRQPFAPKGFALFPAGAERQVPAVGRARGSRLPRAARATRETLRAHARTPSPVRLHARLLSSSRRALSAEEKGPAQTSGQPPRQQHQRLPVAFALLPSLPLSWPLRRLFRRCRGQGPRGLRIAQARCL